MFPPGVVSGTTDASGVFADAADCWTNAAAGNGAHGTSLLLRILPQMESGNAFAQWNFGTSVTGNAKTAMAGDQELLLPQPSDRLSTGNRQPNESDQHDIDGSVLERRWNGLRRPARVG